MYQIPHKCTVGDLKHGVSSGVMDNSGFQVPERSRWPNIIHLPIFHLQEASKGKPVSVNLFRCVFLLLARLHGMSFTIQFRGTAFQIILFSTQLNTIRQKRREFSVFKRLGFLFPRSLTFPPPSAHEIRSLLKNVFKVGLICWFN